MADTSKNAKTVTIDMETAIELMNDADTALEGYEEVRRMCPDEVDDMAGVIRYLRYVMLAALEDAE